MGFVSFVDFLYHRVLFLLSFHSNQDCGKNLFIFCLTLVDLLSLAAKKVVKTNMTSDNADVPTLVHNHQDASFLSSWRSLRTAKFRNVLHEDKQCLNQWSARYLNPLLLLTQLDSISI